MNPSSTTLSKAGISAVSLQLQRQTLSLIVHSLIVKIYLTHLTFVYTKMLKYCKYQNTINQVKVKESYKDNFRGQQCQFKQRTNLGCLRRLFRVTILEDEV
ncbi:Hypothetical_protein [Hexamita inflata]|uniref:Hypothetical_protein n=1 Tax=Hexamita inflata TaxID=28002 RepID=A0AA86TZT8_9EUKA|nr:Hypothetical protein HINF_LOCUS22409 [Hexamita inflata]